MGLPAPRSAGLRIPTRASVCIVSVRAHCPGSSQVLPPVPSSSPTRVHVLTCLPPSFYSSFCDLSVHISNHYNNALSRSRFSACDLSVSEFSAHGPSLLHPHRCGEGGQKGKGERHLTGCCLSPLPALRSREEWRGQQGTKREDEEVEDSQEAPCGWLRPPADLRTRQPPEKVGHPEQTPQGTQTAPLQQLSCAQTIAPAASRKFCRGPCSCRARISPNTLTHACALRWAPYRASPWSLRCHQLVCVPGMGPPGTHCTDAAVGTAGARPECQEPGAAAMGTASGSGCPLLPSSYAPPGEGVLGSQRVAPRFALRDVLFTESQNGQGWKGPPWVI